MATWTEHIKAFRDDAFGKKVIDIFEEVIIVILLIGGIALVHKVLNAFLGHDAKLLDRIPIRYIIDVGHGLAIVRFIFEIVRDIAEICREIKRGRSKSVGTTP